MAQVFTIEDMQKGHKGTTLIYFTQRSQKPLALPRSLAKKFSIGDHVKFRGHKLCKC